MREDRKDIIDGLYWWNMFPFAYKVEGEPLRDPFHIKEGESLYFRLAPHVSEWANVLLMKALIDVNIMYTTEKVGEYRLRQQAQHVLQEKAGKLGYYASRVSRIFFGIFNHAVIIALVGVQAIVEPSIITWVFFALNLINLSYMMKGSSQANELKTQLFISSVIKVYSLAVIIFTIFVLANTYKIDHNASWKSMKDWL